MFFKNLGISFFKEDFLEAASDYTATKFRKTVLMSISIFCAHYHQLNLFYGTDRVLKRKKNTLSYRKNHFLLLKKPKNNF